MFGIDVHSEIVSSVNVLLQSSAIKEGPNCLVTVIVKNTHSDLERGY